MKNKQITSFKKKKKVAKAKLPKERNIYKVRNEIHDEEEIFCPAFTAPLMDFDFLQIDEMEDGY